MGLPSHVHGENGIHFLQFRTFTPNSEQKNTGYGFGKWEGKICNAVYITKFHKLPGRQSFVPFTNSKKSGLPIVRCIPETTFQKISMVQRTQHVKIRSYSAVYSRKYDIRLDIKYIY